MAHPWIAAASAAGNGVFTSSRSWHRSLAARALCGMLDAARVHTHPNRPLVDAGGIPLDLMDAPTLLPKHGLWEREGHLLFLFTDHTVLAARRVGESQYAQVVPWIWRLSHTPTVEGLPPNAGLVISTMGQKGPKARTMLCLTGADEGHNTWMVNLDPKMHHNLLLGVPHRQVAGYERLRSALDAALDGMVALLEEAPPLSNRMEDIGGPFWVPPFQQLSWGQHSLQQHTDLTADIGVLLALWGAGELLLRGAFLQADGTVDTTGLERGVGDVSVPHALFHDALVAILARHGLPPTALVFQEQDKPKQPLEQPLLAYIPTPQPSAHERLAMQAFLAAQGVDVHALRGKASA